MLSIRRLIMQGSMVIFQAMAFEGSSFTNGHFSSPSVFNHSFLEFYFYFFCDVASTCFVHNTSYLLLPTPTLCQLVSGAQNWLSRDHSPPESHVARPRQRRHPIGLSWVWVWVCSSWLLTIAYHQKLGCQLSNIGPSSIVQHSTIRLSIVNDQCQLSMVRLLIIQ